MIKNKDNLIADLTTNIDVEAITKNKLKDNTKLEKNYLNIIKIIMMKKIIKWKMTI